jgi:very-short-patch-repair endonuclease
MVWSRLKGRGRGRPVFRRQHPYESMIFDFYCAAAKLAVEIDGSTHWSDEAGAKDAARDAWLAGRGLTVMRIPAGWVYRDLTAVMDAIYAKADELIASR